MEEKTDQEKLYEEAYKKVKLGEELKKALTDFEELPGVSKVQRKIQQELKFLNKVLLCYIILESFTSLRFLQGDYHKVR